MSDSELSELHDSDPEPDLDQTQDAALSQQLFMRPCKFNGHHRLIFQHNPRELPTPPPLVALYNYLVLTESADTKFPRNLQEEEVWKLPLQRRLVELKVKLSTKDHLEAVNMYTFEGHNINLVPIRTKGTESFERPKAGDDGTRLFFLICQKLGIKVHHGCLENPQDPENGEGQLTRFGLKCLSENIEEGNLALFFRKDHLSVVCKHHGTLFVLETNVYSWIKKKCSPMWGTLNLSDLEVVLFTYRFTPADMRLQRNAQEQSVVEFIGKWNQDEEARKNELDDTSLFDSESEGNKSHKPPGKKIGVKKSRLRKKHADKSDTSIQGSTDEKLNESVGAEDSAQRPCDDTGENAAGAESSATRPDDEYDWIKKSAMSFFDTFKDPDDEMPDGNNDLSSYVRMVEALKAQPKGRRTNLVHINFPDIAGHDPALAVAILNDRNRLEKLLAEVFLDFRVKHNCGNKEQLKGKIKIRFHDMPPADSVQLLVVFLDSNNINLAELHTFYDGKTATSTSFWGRRVGKGYVDDIIENHRNHRSWNGEFELSDMVIINGKFQILKSAEATATSDTMCKDFLKLIELLFKRYELPNAEGKPTPPAYFDIFLQEVMKRMSLYDDPDPRKFRAFQRYLSHHPAFKAPWVRSALFGDVWRVIQALRRIIPGEHIKRDPFDRLRQPIGDFLALAKTAWEFEKVYGFSHTPGETDINRYRSCLLVNFLEFLRHLDEHLLDHTRDNNGEQKVKDIIHVDLMIGNVYEVQVATLIRQMMLDLTDAPFASSWRHYEMSECELDNTDPESGKEDKVESKDISDSGSNIVIGSVNEKNAQLGGMDTSASGSGSK